METLNDSLASTAEFLSHEILKLRCLPKSNLNSTAVNIYSDALKQINNFKQILQTCQNN